MFEPIVLVNGVLGGGVSPLDRGFNYGDGLFETVRLSVSAAGVGLPLWKFHCERLMRDSKRLKIPLCEEVLQAHVERILAEARAAGIESAVAKIVLTRGVGGRGYLPSVDAVPTICVGLYPPPAYPLEYSQRGVGLHQCVQPLSFNSLLAGIKHLNKLEYVMARSEWSDSNIPEGILLDAEGRIVEGTFTNVFLVRKGILITPLLKRCGVAGVMRQLIMQVLAPKLDLQVEEVDILQTDLAAADEVFVCNSVCGIWPVLSLGVERWRVGGVTQSLQAQLDAYLRVVVDA